MKQFIEKIKRLITEKELKVIKDSYASSDSLRAVCAVVGGEERLIVDGPGSDLFQGEILGESIKICPMDHANRLVLNQEFAYTAPRALGRACASIGCGDRLGIAGAGQLSAMKETTVRPVLAQQSLRELTLTGRSLDDVLDEAAWAVFKSGYRKGYGADGDHLKTLEEVGEALEHGVSMITLDCSLVLTQTPSDEGQRKELYEKFPEDYRIRLEREYLRDDRMEALGIFFDKDILEETVIVYHEAVELAEKVYLLLQKTGRPMDLEISLDETAHRTAVTAHYFVANELKNRHVEINSLAPRFVGEFQKAVDYIGDVDEFREDLRAHCRIADLFGYKISVHSGSDKFKIFSVVAEETKGRFHLKTSGTSWLEAVRVIARTEPELYRDMHRTALENFQKASAYYVVHCDPARVAPLDSVPDEELPDYLEQDDARQLLHITYGAMLKENPKLRERIFEALKKHADEYEKDLKEHFMKHLRLLVLQKNNK